MTEPSYTIALNRRLVAATAVEVGDLLVYDEADGYYVVATTSNRSGGKRAEAIALSAFQSDDPDAVGRVHVQQAGTATDAVTGLGAGAVGYVRSSSTGRCERVTDFTDGDDIIGSCEADGRVHLHFGAPVGEILSTAESTASAAATALYPGGSVGDLQYKGGTATFSGTSKLRVESSEIVHTGTPLHKETRSEFYDGSATSFSFSQWETGATTTDSAVTIGSIELASGLGDCIVTVHADLTYSFVSSGAKGGNLAYKAAFKRSSGTLSRIGIADISIPTLLTGTESGGVDLATNGNTTIDIKPTGIADTNITWTASLHVQVAKVPA